MNVDFKVSNIDFEVMLTNVDECGTLNPNFVFLNENNISDYYKLKIVATGDAQKNLRNVIKMHP